MIFILLFFIGLCIISIKKLIDSDEKDYKVWLLALVASFIGVTIILFILNRIIALILIGTWIFVFAIAFVVVIMDFIETLKQYDILEKLKF